MLQPSQPVTNPKVPQLPLHWALKPGLRAVETGRPFNALSPRKTGNIGAMRAVRLHPFFPGSQSRWEQTSSTSQQRESRARTLGLPQESRAEVQHLNQVSKKEPRMEASTHGEKRHNKAYSAVLRGLDPDLLESRKSLFNGFNSNGFSVTSLLSSLQRKCQKLCSRASQKCYPLNSYCTWCHQPPAICCQPTFRMLPLITPPARALCRATLSLPPP